MISIKNLKLITAFAVFSFCITLSVTDGWAKKSFKKEEVPAPAASVPVPIMTAPRGVTLPPGFNPAPPASVGKPVMNSANTALPPGFNPPGYKGSFTPSVAPASKPEEMKVRRKHKARTKKKAIMEKAKEAEEEAMTAAKAGEKKEEER